MSMLCETVEDAALGMVVADRPEDLGAFLKPGCAAAIWRREPVAGFHAWIGALAPDRLPRGRVVVAREAVADAVAQLCDMAATSAGDARDWLIEDVTQLAALFGDLMKARYLRLRLDVVTTNACRKFHIDSVAARLICTYRGVGTQYGVSRDGADPARVFTVPTGAALLLRGSLWPAQPASGLLHRSPPIEGTGETRLLLVLDPIADPAEAC